MSFPLNSFLRTQSREREMKLSAKPIQSPGRPEKYPATPLLMRRLRLQGGSRSRRSRSGTRPTFSLLRRKASNYEPTSTQEPSSPKVTFIGQVRVKKKKPATSSATTTTGTVRRKRFPILCRCFTVRSKSVWQRFMSAIHDASRKHSDEEEEEAAEQKDRVVVVVPTDTNAGDRKEEARISVGEPEPPKNALLLMRCRSAPLRDSSPVTTQFWESPAVNAKEEIQNEKEIADQETLEAEEDGRRQSTSPAEGKRRRRTGDSSEGILGIGKDGERVPVLTRCKSEPRAPNVGPVFPEAYFWKRRMGF